MPLHEFHETHANAVIAQKTSALLRMTDRQSDRHLDGWTDIQMDRLKKEGKFENDH